MNDECGVLIEGFEREPMIRQAWQPPYYQRLCEEAGLDKAVDLFMWSLHISGRDNVMPIIWELAEQLEPKHGITIRKMTRRGLRRDLDAFAEIYNEAWSRNWGFVPYSKEDLDAYAQELHLVFDRNWFMVAEDGRREDGGRGDHGAGHQPGAEADERAAAADGLVALPAPAPHRRPLPGRVPRREARLPAHRRGRRAVRRALRDGRDDTRQGRRDGLDPRDQQGDEPRHGGDGRRDREEVPGATSAAALSESARRWPGYTRPLVPEPLEPEPQRGRRPPAPGARRAAPDRAPAPGGPPGRGGGRHRRLPARRGHLRAGEAAATTAVRLAEPRTRPRAGKRVEVATSRSFLVDIHLLKDR